MRRPSLATAAVNKDKALGIKVTMSEARLLIAVVDDDKSAGKALGRLLRAVGLHAETFVSGSEFLKWLQNHAPHCVVLDQDMPQMDGFEVQSQLAQIGAHVPVVMITGLQTQEACERAMEKGATAYLPKPVDAELLLDTIATVIARARGPRNNQVLNCRCLRKAEKDKLRTRKLKPDRTSQL
jgi:FixJ family two-component response regulator